MIYTTKDLLLSGETEYSIRKKVSEGKIFLVERGIYSSEERPFVDEAYLSKKYGEAILTGPSALYLNAPCEPLPHEQRPVVWRGATEEVFPLLRQFLPSECAERQQLPPHRVLVFHFCHPSFLLVGDCDTLKHDNIIISSGLQDVFSICAIWSSKHRETLYRCGDDTGNLVQRRRRGILFQFDATTSGFHGQISFR